MAAVPTIRELAAGREPVPATMTEAEYLRTVFHPDCDFVDGRIEGRNVGEVEHSRVQKMILRLFSVSEEEWGVEALPECRLQVAPARYRVPDVMVLRREQRVDRIVRQAPLICVEILSPDDTWKRLRDVLGDYLAMGVENIWAFDPDTRTAHRFDATGLHRISDAELGVAGTAIRLVIADVFSMLRAV